MSGERDDGNATDTNGANGGNVGESGNGEQIESSATEWPVPLTGVTESVVTTLGPNGLWNVAALGLFADDRGNEGVDGDREGDDNRNSDGDRNNDDNRNSDDNGDRNTETTVTARTWGNTRTRRNFHRQGEGYVQFVDDPVTFADAALTVSELEEPVLDDANAWVHVSVDQLDSGTDDGTEWEQWKLEPVEAEIERETVPTIDRGFGAVIEATVAASRLGVPGYDQAELRDRLEFYASVVERAGGPRERAALERVRENTSW